MSILITIRTLYRSSYRYLCLGALGVLASGCVDIVNVDLGLSTEALGISDAKTHSPKSTQNFSYYSPEVVLTVDLPVELIAPNTLDKTVEYYSITPSLPSGLELDSKTGIISGTPLMISPAIPYVVTAFTQDGILTASLSIRVNDSAPDLSYSGGSFIFIKGRMISNIEPTNSGGPTVSCTATPDLPLGLHLNSSCVLSGTPISISPSTPYSITATNTGGSTVTRLSLSIIDSEPAFSYATSPVVVTKYQQIIPQTPVHTGGAIERCNINPTLPTGLTLSQNCIITGVPTDTSPETTYVVTGTNLAGSGTAELKITVHDIAPTSLTYSSDPAIYTLGSLLLSENIPSSSGGGITGFSISPPLAPGLLFNSSTGAISGTPGVITAPTVYTVTATNSGGSIQGTVTITVNDIAPSNLTYSDNTSVYSLGSSITPNIPSSTGGTVTSYSISPQLPAGLSIHPATGVISGIPTAIAGSAAYTVTALNSGGSTQAILNITINNIPPSQLTYSDSAAIYTKDSAISPNTPSSQGGSVVTYMISPSLPAGLSLNSSNGIISGTPTVISAATSYTVTATNSGGSTQAHLSIIVNDQPQTNLAYSLNPAIYTKGSTIQANSPSSSGGAAESYSIAPALPGGLSLNTLTGVISGTPTEIATSSFYTVTATNSGGSAQVTLSLTVNDVAPSNLSYAHDFENYTKDSAIRVNTPSSLGGPVVNYTISPALTAGLILDPTTGVISGTPTAIAPSSSYTIVANNSGGSAQTIIHFTVNDIAPSNLTYSHNPVEYTKGSAIASNAPSSTGGPIVSYTVSPALPAGLSIHSSTGVLSGTPTALAAAAPYVVTATNSGGSAEVTLDLTVKDVAPSNLSYSVPTALYTKGTSITPNMPSSNGGAVTNYTVSPALPAGLSLNSTSGVVSGTPTTLVGTASYTVTATNSGGSAQTNLNITVNDQAPTDLTYTHNSPVYTKGVLIADNSPTSNGGAIDRFSIAPALPTGLSLDSNSGVISGTPASISPAKVYTVTATNTGGSITALLALAVNDVPPSNLTYSSNPAVYTQESAIPDNVPNFNGGVVAYYSISPSLPAGLSFNTSTGVISGTPTALRPSMSYVVTATNSGGSTTTSLSLTVNAVAPSNLSYSVSPAVYTLGLAIINNTPTSSGGPIISYSIFPALPAGLSMSPSTGVISGTPTTVTASQPYTVTANNSGGSTSVSLTITVNDVAPSDLSYSTNPAVYTKGSVITNNTPLSTGGEVVSYSVFPSLPSGLSLDASSGNISGTPSTIVPLNSYLVTATNSGGSTSVNLSITVNDVAPTTLTYTVNPAIYTKDTPITDNLPSSGGGSITSYSIFPNLPSGLSLDSSTGAISGTPSTLSPTISYLVTATGTGGSTTFDFTLTVIDIAPSDLSYASNSAIYTRASAIVPNTPTSSGGAVISYSVSPSLPAGLSLNTSTGVISGTPSSIRASEPYVVTAFNSGGSTTATLNLTVNDIAPSILTYSSNPAVYTKGSTISNNTPASDSTIISYTISPALPTGLAFSTSTGVISGTPTVVAAATSHTVTAINSGGSTSTLLNLTVNDIAPSNFHYDSSPAVYTKDSPIADNTPSSTGGAIISYSVSPQLPAGLSLNSSTGVISGTPTTITPVQNYTVTAINSGGSATTDVTITVNDIALSDFTYEVNPAIYRVGTEIVNNTPSLSGGSAVSFSISTPLPAGLSLDTLTGVISGTPTAIQPTTSYMVTAMNSAGPTTASLNVTIIDIAPSNLSYSSISSIYTKGISISENSPTSEGGPVISYSISPALPSGLAFNTQTGVISGTPSVLTPSQSHTITATNSGGSATTSITLVVNDVAPFNLSYLVSSATYTKNLEISNNIPTSSGGPVISYSVSPQLPSGLALDSTTGVIFGIPTVIQPAASYTVTATNSGGSTSVSLSLTVNDVAPSDLSFSTNPAVYTRGSAISNNIPTSSGGPVTGYSISPALPSGLSLNTTTGVISGTASAISPSTSYTVTATNSGGSTTASLTLTVNDIAPFNLAYFTNPAVYTKGSAISNNAPTSSGGPVVSYSVFPSLPSGLSLDPDSGNISGTPGAITPLNSYLITAINSGGSTSVSLTLTVNDVAPDTLTYNVNPAIYTKGTAIADNTPSSSGGSITDYSIFPALPLGLTLNSTTGVISGTPSTLSAITTYLVTATGTGGSTTFEFTLTVNDIAPSDLTYSEANEVYTKGSTISNNTPTSNGGAVISYAISPALPVGLDLNTTTGVISGTPSVISPSTPYTVTATNSGGSTTALLNFTINDIAPSNLGYATNPAVYTRNSAISENTPTSTGGSVVSYSVSPALPAGLILNPSTGVISGTPTSITPSAPYTVTATNSGGSTTVSLTLTVNDITPSNLTYSSNPAVYTKESSISDNTPTVNGAVISFSVSPNLPAGLLLNASTGVISGTPTAVTPLQSYTITATNSGGSATTSITLTVNDVAPSNLGYSVSPAVYTKGLAISENSPSSSGGPVVSYSVSDPLPAGLSLNTTTGVISGTPTAITSSASYLISATNSGGSTSVSITITVNDVAPSSLSYSSNSAVYTKGSAISNNNPSSSGGDVVSYSVAPALPLGLSLNSSTGVISGTPTTVTPSSSYTVTATNSGGSTTATLSLTVNDVAPSNLTYFTNPAIYTKSSAISVNSPSSSGGAIVSYSVSPSLPAGLALNTTTGVISGTPTTITSTATYTVTAANSGGFTSVSLTLTINDVAPSSLSYSTNPAAYTRGSAISDNTPSSSGGPVISYSISPALPSGLSFNTSTGVISGTPSVISASTSYTVTGTNSGGSTTASLTLTVNDIAPSSLDYSTNPAVYTKGSAISSNTPTSSGGAVVSYSVLPSLPSGLVLNTSSGIISGTPSAVAASTSYLVTATNSGGSTSVSLTITVNDNAPTALTYTLNPAVYTRGTAISNNSPSSGGGSITSYSISPDLPSGLSLNTSTGVISGTPSAISPSTSYTVTATNTGGSTTASLTLTVNDIAPSSLAYTTPSTYIKGTAITANTPTSSGGPIVSYSVSPNLPTGLSLNTSTGVISGTPSVIQGFTSYTVTAINSGGATTASLSIKINDVAPSSLTYSTNPATYSINIAIPNNNPSSSGGSVVSYSVSPTLPTGLSLNTSTGVISGTPTALTSAANYTVTATNSGGSTTVSVNIAITTPKLAFVSSPSSQTYTAGANFSPALTVAVQDSTGATLTSSTAPVTLALVTNTAGGTLTGTLTRSAVNGIATFDDIKLNKPASNYTMAATSSGFTTTPTTSAFTINAGTASQLIFSSGVSSTNVNTCAGPYQITIQDSLGNTATNSSGSAWNLSLSENGSAGFYADSACSGGTISQISIASGQSTSGQFYIKDTVGETVTLTVDGTYAGLGSQTYSVSVISSVTISGSPRIWSDGTVATSCNAYMSGLSAPYTYAGSTGSGVYSIKPVGAASAYSAYCDMTTDGGGWTLAAIPSTTANIFGETSSTLTDPNATVGQRNQNIWSATENTFTFNRFRVTDGTTTSGAIANFTSTYTLSSLLSSRPSYSQSAAVPTTSITSTISASYFVVRGMSAAVALYNDGADFMFMGFIGGSAPPFNQGDSWDTANYTTTWCLGCTDNTTDPINQPHGVGKATSAGHWSQNSNNTRTLVWLKNTVVPPYNLSYSAPSASYPLGTAISNNTPSYSGTAISSFSISPSTLPTGLSFNTSTGIISGTPTVITSSTNYTVTATNSAGSTQTTISLAVVPSGKLAFISSPGGQTYAAGTNFSPALTIAIQDGSGVTQTSSSAAVTIALVTNTAGGTLTGTLTRSAVNGIATFDDIKLNKIASNYTMTATSGSLTAAPTTAAFTIVAGAASQLTFSSGTSVTPPGTCAGPYLLSIQDAVGNTATNSSGSPLNIALSQTGSASFYEDSACTGSTISAITVGTGQSNSSQFYLKDSAAENITLTADGTSFGAGTITYSVVVNVAPSSLTYSTNPAVYTKGSPITANTPASSGGSVASYSISPTLPTGLSFNTSTGIISGTPTALSSLTSYTVTAINSAGSTTANLSVTVNDVPPSSLSYTNMSPTYTKGSVIAANNPTSSGGAVVTYTVSPSLPAGLSLNSTSGVITGTPTVVVGSTTYTVTGTNTGGSAQATLTIIVNDIAPTSLSYSTNPAVYSINYTISNNTPTNSGGAVISYSISPALPDGLSFNTSTGVISGTPTTETAAANYTVTATNSGGSGSVVVNIAVSTAVPMTAFTYPASSYSFQPNSPITTVTPTITGGVPASCTSNLALPSGLSINSTTCAISGTPTGSGGALATYTITATNAASSLSTTVSISIVGQTQQWTWFSGSNATTQSGVYGTRGVAASTNVPGARDEPRTWKDASGNFWLFGGVGYVSGSSVYSNDIWKWDGVNWTWVNGSNSGNQSGTYGTKGTAASTNVPGGRYAATSCTDPSGNLWLMGGVGYAGGTNGRLSDLWKWNGTNWTWISGTNSLDSGGTWGTKGTPSPSNLPGSRMYSSSWTDASGNFWLFGGYAYPPSGGIIPLNDLWKWDGTNWTWVSGSNANAAGSYGTKGVPAASNVPGSRTTPAFWKDLNGNFWVFGGYGNAATTTAGYLNDLWKWDGTNWTWMAGSNTISSAGSYGTKGTAASSNTPGARGESFPAGVDSSGNAWMFGGYSTGQLNDLWKWDGTNWTWVSGSNSVNQSGNYGTKKVSAPSNVPGSRYRSGLWIDSGDSIWIFGGWGYDATTSSSRLNDLWRFTY